MPTHIFFDLDKTLTMSRSPMAAAHQEVFDKLCAQKDVVVVSGGSAEQIQEQVTERFNGRYITLAQSGNHAIDSSGKELWNEKLTESQVAAILSLISVLKPYFALPLGEEKEHVENRGGQITYSVVGFHAPIESKYSFDPKDSVRSAALAAHPDEMQKLKAAEVEVAPAGTTSFNFILAGHHKGYNVARLNTLLNWSKEDCLYIGDALFSGGNDETVVGVIPTHAVSDPNETFSFIMNNLIS